MRCLPSLAICISLTLLGAQAAAAKDCDATSVGFTPLTDLGAGSYLGLEGGLYPGGQNIPPAAHMAAALARAGTVRKLDGTGLPDPAGRYVLLSIGMSNTTQEFCSASGAEPCDAWTFMGQAALHPDVRPEGLVIVNGARGGQDARTWDSPTDPNYDHVRDSVLAPRGLTEAQVQAVWIKQAPRSRRCQGPAWTPTPATSTTTRSRRCSHGTLPVGRWTRGEIRWADLDL